MNPNPPSTPPLTEAELHAWVDRQLTPERQREIEAYLAHRPDEAQRAQRYRDQKRELRALFDPVLDEAVPQRLLRAAQPRTPWYLQRLAAGVAIALLSGAAGWGLRGGLEEAPPAGLASQGPTSIALASASGFARRAAVAHAVYSPEQRRPVEVDAAHEDQLVTWLSKRMGAPMKPPHLQAVGYALEGGRLLPGGQGPVAQFMYQRIDATGPGGRLTLYVSNEIGDVRAAAGGASGKERGAGTAFRFAREGSINVFYWVEGRFGYAISADADRATLARVAEAVYRQLGSPPR
ncbi:MAG: anti-sigma factor [Burkholderiales bacterium]|nr:anti-sigma factor [Burkholderiales bacterium]